MKFSTDHVPVYSTPFAQVAGTVMLLSTQGHVSLFDAGTRRLIRRLPFGDTASPRLHPSGYIYYVTGRELRRERVSGGGSEVVHAFGSNVTIGGNEGDFDPTFRYLPIVRSEHVGILDVDSGRYVETHAGPGIDWAQVGSGDVLAVGFKSPERIVAFVRSGTTLERGRKLAPALGHSDPATINGRPHLVTTTSNWRSGWPRGGGGEEWLVGIDMQSGAMMSVRETGWRAQHIACWRDWVCVSFYSAGIPPAHPRGEIWLGRLDGSEGQVVAVAEGAAPDPYIAQPHAAWSADGRRIYYGEGGGTRVLNVNGMTGVTEPVDPPPPKPKPRRRSCWDRLLGR